MPIVFPAQWFDSMRLPPPVMRIPDPPTWFWQVLPVTREPLDTVIPLERLRPALQFVTEEPESVLIPLPILFATVQLVTVQPAPVRIPIAKFLVAVQSKIAQSASARIP